VPFNMPPNWPTPPAGWQPPPGWSPDPSWPPAPPGWQFWTDNHGPKRPGMVTTMRNRWKSLTAQRLPFNFGTVRGRLRATVETLANVANPARAGYAIAALTGLSMFGFLFVALRFTPQWTGDGWLWQGLWPLLAMLAGLLIGIVGVIGVRRWDNARWRKYAAVSGTQ